MAEHSDGSIIVDAEINSEGFKADSAELQRAVKSLSSQMDKLGPAFQKAVSGNTFALSTFHTKAETLESTITTLEEKLSALGEKRVQTDDYKWVTAEIEKAENAVDRLSARQSKMQATGVKENSKAYQSLQYDIEQARRKLDDLLATKQILENSGQAFTLGADTGEYQRLATNLDAARQRLAELRAEAAQTGEEVSSSWSRMTTLSGMLRGAFSSAFSAIRSAVPTVGTTIKSVAAAGVEKLAAGLKQVASYAAKAALSFLHLGKNTRSANAGFASGFKMLLKYGLGIRSLYALSNKMRSALVTGFQNLAQYSDSTNKAISSVTSSLAQLKNSLATAFSPILTVVAPILSRLINMLSTAITYIGMFFAALTGAKTFTKATAVQQDYAASLNGTASAAKSAADAEEEAATQLAAFDEINVLSDNAADNSGSGGGGADVGSMFEEVPIESSVASFVSRIKEAFVNGEYAEIGHIIGEGVNRAFQKIHDFIKWDSIGATLTYYIEAFCAIFNSLTDAVDWNLIGAAFAEGFNTVVNSLYLLLTGINWTALGAAFSEGLNGLVQNVDWEKFGSTISEFFSAKLHLLHGVLTNFDWYQLGADVKKLLCSIDWAGIMEEFFGVIGAALGGLAEFLWGLIEDAWNSVIDWWHDVAYEDGSFTIEGLLNGILNVLKNIGSWIKEHIFNPFIDGFKSVFGIHSPSTVMAELGGYLIEGLLNGLKDNWLNLTDFLSGALSDVKSAFSTTWSNIKETISNAAANIYGTVSDKFSKVSSTVREKVGSVQSTVSEGFSNVKDSITTKLSDAMREISSLDWQSIGSDICNGISTGISNGWTWLKTTVSNLATNLLNSAKDALDIHSPSRLFRDEVGLMLGLGVAEGMDASKGGILRTVSGIAGAITDEFGVESYTIPKIGIGGITGALDNFSTEISDSFSHLVDTLNAIAERVTFTVPVVATGTVIPPNTQFRAAIGDQTSGNNIEAPESLIRKIVREETGGGNTELLQEILEAIRAGQVIKVNETVLGRTSAKAINKLTQASGKSVLLW